MISVHAGESDAFNVSLLEWWRRLCRRRNSLAELDHFRTGLELLGRDVNLSPWHLRAAAKWPDDGDLLRRRLMTLQIDPELLSSAQFGRAQGSRTGLHAMRRARIAFSASIAPPSIRSWQATAAGS
jgi:hypothetical protein